METLIKQLQYLMERSFTYQDNSKTRFFKEFWQGYQSIILECLIKLQHKESIEHYLYVRHIDMVSNNLASNYCSDNFWYKGEEAAIGAIRHHLQIKRT